METIESSTIPALNAGMSPDEQKRSCTLYYLLAMLADGRAQSMVTNCVSGNGYELWRRIVQAYEPKVASRSQGLLVQILMFAFDMGDFMASLERWETLVRQYDGTVSTPAESIQDSVKTATVISRIAKGPLQDHLMLNAARFSSYDDLRKEMTEILRAQHFMARPGAVHAHGPVPMEIGALGKSPNTSRQRA